MQNLTTDLLIIGGGINGAGIAADAAGRGLTTILCEQKDLASATSSWSTKLIHGGLRYLEYYEFRLVREALREREVLLNKAPHLIHPLEFILPHESHLRPAWMIRAGLFLYDHLGKRVTLPNSKTIDFKTHPAGTALKSHFSKGFSYYDCRTDDARLVVLNALFAKNYGAMILTRTQFCSATRKHNRWIAQLKNPLTNEAIEINAKAIVNATGPWVAEVLEQKLQMPSPVKVNLVKGSHIVVPKMYEGDHAYILQNEDRRIVFAIPYQNQFTLIGTTDVDYHDDPETVTISTDEIEYLCNIINNYFKKQITSNDIKWTYSGVRALHDGDEKHPEKITREYRLELNVEQDAPLLSVFGGKITTFRKLSEHALEKLKPFFPAMSPAWTSKAKLPGGDLKELSFSTFVTQLKNTYDWLPAPIIERYAGSYGSLTHQLLHNAKNIDDMGTHFGAGLYAKEVQYLKQHEWARTVEDIIWRRSKLGLFLDNSQQQRLQEYLVDV